MSQDQKPKFDMQDFHQLKYETERFVREVVYTISKEKKTELSREDLECIAENVAERVQQMLPEEYNNMLRRRAG